MNRDATITSNAISCRSLRLMDAGRPPQTVKPVSATDYTNTPEPVVSFAGSAPLREPSAKAATHCTEGTSP